VFEEGGVPAGDSDQPPQQQEYDVEAAAALAENFGFYLWNKDKGYENVGNWIEKAAKDAGK
jgi:hypothetical protein